MIFNTTVNIFNKKYIDKNMYINYFNHFGCSKVPPVIQVYIEPNMSICCCITPMSLISLGY